VVSATSAPAPPGDSGFPGKGADVELVTTDGAPTGCGLATGAGSDEAGVSAISLAFG